MQRNRHKYRIRCLHQRDPADLPDLGYPLLLLGRRLLRDLLAPLLLPIHWFHSRRSFRPVLPGLLVPWHPLVRRLLLAQLVQLVRSHP